MLTEVKNQFKVTRLNIKYSLMRELLNKVTFISNVVFMILNNACFIVEWIVLYSIKDNIGGYTLKQVLLLWGIAASTYGFSHFFFKKCYNLSDAINTGKLDAYLVQPKNVLLSSITSEIDVSAIGDMIYGYIMLIIYGFTIKRFLLFTLLVITGGLIMTAVAVILGSLSFWFGKSEAIAETGNNLMVNFATYPGGIFKGVVKVLLYTLIPVGITTYIPVQLLTKFNIWEFLIIISVTLFLIFIAFLIFNTGIKRYSSSNLMIART